MLWNIQEIEVFGRILKTKLLNKHQFQNPDTTLLYTVSLLYRILEPNPKPLFLEYPEFSLHPRVQCELASLLLGISQKRLVFLNTQSDFMYDRIYTDLKNNTCGKYKPSDFLLLSFDRDKVHKVTLDENFTICAHDNYRQFFMEETAKFLGLPSKP